MLFKLKSDNDFPDLFSVGENRKDDWTKYDAKKSENLYPVFYRYCTDT